LLDLPCNSTEQRIWARFAVEIANRLEVAAGHPPRPRYSRNASGRGRTSRKGREYVVTRKPASTIQALKIKMACSDEDNDDSAKHRRVYELG
jgi:hypothetical protein